MDEGFEKTSKKYKMLTKQEYKICIYQKKVINLQKIYERGLCREGVCGGRIGYEKGDKGISNL